MPYTATGGTYCLICMPYMYALYVCLTCMPYTATGGTYCRATTCASSCGTSTWSPSPSAPFVIFFFVNPSPIFYVLCFFFCASCGTSTWSPSPSAPFVSPFSLSLSAYIYLLISISLYLSPCVSISVLCFCFSCKLWDVDMESKPIIFTI
jgi:hypothetical protein